jgi:hypothetical protein
MIYRKKPAQAPRLLLRVAAGASAVLAVACSSSSSSGTEGPEGSTISPDSGEDATTDGGFVCNGVCVYPDSGPNGIQSDGTAPFNDAYPWDNPDAGTGDAQTSDGPVGVAMEGGSDS